MTFFYKYGAMAAIIVALLGSAYIWHKGEIKVAVKEAEIALQDSYRIELGEARKRLAAQALTAEKNLKEQFNNETRIKDEKINTLNSNVAGLRNSLRNRPERGSSGFPSNGTTNPSDSKVAQGSTGAKLFREDSEFLIGEAARAELIRSELQFCYAQYDNVWRLLQTYGK